MLPVERSFIWNPPAEDIATGLNQAAAVSCIHDRSPCYLRCGVRQNAARHWRPIPQSERLRWLREWLASYTEEERAELDDGRPSRLDTTAKDPSP